MKKITPFLWFNNNANEAASFYVSIFKNSKIIESNPMTVLFELEGEEFVALNGGPQYTFNPAISFVINCETQEDIDYYWEKLGAGGEYQQCGWLKDMYGISWQVIPTSLPSMLTSEDQVKAKRVMTKMLQMKKIELDILEKAFIEA
jgi:predicted 3-demethylubiquinone-9 3-methyltransferase (glyoxalase superfamily)